MRSAGGGIRLLQEGVARHHRRGWSCAVEHLVDLQRADGVPFDAYGEHTSGWRPGAGAPPPTSPWLGVVHDPPYSPAWFPVGARSLEDVLRDETWPAVTGRCLGLFTLSRHLRDWLAPRVTVPVEPVVHPTRPPYLSFGMDAYRRNPAPMVVQIGAWSRRTRSLYELPVSTVTKAILVGPDVVARTVHEVELALLPNDAALAGVLTIPHLDDYQYDRILSRNVVFLDLYDCSADSAIVECIARATPLLVNPLPAVVEYLGPEYPMYFEDLEQAAMMADDEALVGATHHYLCELPLRDRLTGEAFRQAIVDSGIYRRSTAG